MSTVGIVAFAIEGGALPEGGSSEEVLASFAQAASRAMEGVHVLSKHDVARVEGRDESVPRPSDFEWDPEDEPSFPLSREQALALADEQGQVSVVVSMQKDWYLNGYADFVRGSSSDHHDSAHRVAFGQEGVPYASTCEVIGVAGDEFIVEYTTGIEGFGL